MSEFWIGAIWASIFWILVYMIAVFIWAFVDARGRGAEMMNTEAANDQHEDFTIPARIKASVGRVTHSDGQIGRFGSYDRDVSPL